MEGANRFGQPISSEEMPEIKPILQLNEASSAMNFYTWIYLDVHETTLLFDCSCLPQRPLKYPYPMLHPAGRAIQKKNAPGVISWLLASIGLLALSLNPPPLTGVSPSSSRFPT